MTVVDAIEICKQECTSVPPHPLNRPLFIAQVYMREQSVQKHAPCEGSVFLY